MKNFVSAVLLFSFLFMINKIDAQERPKRTGGFTGGEVKGKIVEAGDNKPIEYANIVIFSKEDSSMAAGTISKSDGTFELKPLKPGNYYLEVKFIGYEKVTYDSLRLGRGSMSVSLGEVKLNKVAYTMDGVEVVAEKQMMEYKIDKKVINVNHDATSLSGSAVDILQNTPSVTVDVEGNVSLRGSTSFTVLIDGRQSILDASEALEQIPASTIENIEIITNPSAKYDPEGTAGIINIVLKKNSLSGFSGLLNTDAGFDDKYGGDFLVSYKNNGLTFYVGGNYRNRNYPGTEESLNRTLINDSWLNVKSNGNNKRSRNGYGFKTGLDYNLSDNDVMSLGLRYGDRDGESVGDLNYAEWIDLESIDKYGSSSFSSRGGDYYTATADYMHKFEKKGHELTLQAQYSKRESDEISRNELTDNNGEITSAQKYYEGGPAKRIRVRADYVLPFSETNQLELGYEGKINIDDEYNENFIYDVNSKKYLFQDEFSHTNDSKRNIHSLYSLYRGELGNLGYQAGLRGEYIFREMELVGEDLSYELDRFDVFPTFHFSYAETKTTQLMASYSKRIRRARNHYLEPYLTWTDAYNVRRGNPELKPQYIDAFEAGIQKIYEWGSFSVEGYYRITSDKIERVKSVYSDNVLLSTFENVGKSYSLGTEIMFNSDPFSWWNVSLMANLYDYRQEGELYGKSYDAKSFNWNSRFNNIFKITTATTFQINGMYYGPSESAQGKNEGMFMASLALKHEIIEKTLSLTLQVRDVLNSADHEFESFGDSFYTRSIFDRKAPMASITLSYRINNYKDKRSRDNGDGDFEEGGEGEF
ncbi:MAG: TonB-dependent receptor [Melioribacteraceae bacterium]|nr:TonB-dependent receptor [Melioribacteraceae bacterium]